MLTQNKCEKMLFILMNTPYIFWENNVSNCHFLWTFVLSRTISEFQALNAPDLFFNRQSEIIFGISMGHVCLGYSTVEVLYFFLKCINLQCKLCWLRLIMSSKLKKSMCKWLCSSFNVCSHLESHQDLFTSFTFIHLPIMEK
jgi:hypothetical protein